jgi:hypothetical protein
MNAMLVILATAFLGQAPEVGGSAKVERTADESLDFMKKAVEGYRFAGTAGGEARFRLQPEPVFHMGRQYNDVREGAIFFWLGDEDRPEAAAQIFKVQNQGAPLGLWIHEFTSLSPGTFTAELHGRMVWSPSTPGVELRPLPGATKPADSPAQRLRQMREFAEEFRATDDKGKKGWVELRLLPKPIARYGRPGSKLIDGALFAFVEGTDPEVFLFLEARASDRGREWQYALAPMTVFAVKGSYRGKPVWELPDRMPASDPVKPFFDYTDKSVQP